MNDALFMFKHPKGNFSCYIPKNDITLLSGMGMPTDYWERNTLTDSQYAYMVLRYESLSPTTVLNHILRRSMGV